MGSEGTVTMKAVSHTERWKYNTGLRLTIHSTYEAVVLVSMSECSMSKIVRKPG